MKEKLSSIDLQIGVDIVTAREGNPIGTAKELRRFLASEGYVVAICEELVYDEYNSLYNEKVD